jgi:hypothetical protein
MERSVRFLGLACLFVCGAAIALSQGPTIQSNDLLGRFTAGQTTVYHFDTQTTSVDIGNTGGPMAWDFSALRSDKLKALKGVELGTSPYASEFPQATHAVLDTAFVWRINADAFMAGLGWGSVKSSAAYYYYTLGAEQKYVGLGALATGYLDLQPATAIPIANPRWRNHPVSIEMSYPLQYLKTWDNNFVDSLTGVLTLPIFGSFNIALGNRDSITYTVDAYGMLTIPGGFTQEALRIRKAGKYSYIDTLNGFNIPLQYIFLAANGASVEVGMKDSTVTGGVAQVRYLKWTTPLPVDVKEVADVPASFGLVQNYPNPFNPSTTIGYRVQGTGNSFVRLSVYDILGQEVARLVDGPQVAGEHSVVFNARGLSSGTYHYRLTVFDGKQTLVDTKSMMLVK